MAIHQYMYGQHVIYISKLKLALMSGAGRSFRKCWRGRYSFCVIECLFSRGIWERISSPTAGHLSRPSASCELWIRWYSHYKMYLVNVTLGYYIVIRNLNNIENSILPTHLGKSVGKFILNHLNLQIQILTQSIIQSINKYLWTIARFYAGCYVMHWQSQMYSLPSWNSSFGETSNK